MRFATSLLRCLNFTRLSHFYNNLSASFSFLHKNNYTSFACAIGSDFNTHCAPKLFSMEKKEERNCNKISAIQCGKCELSRQQLKNCNFPQVR